MEDSFIHNEDLSNAEKHPFLGSRPQSRYNRVWSLVWFIALSVSAALVFTAGRWSVSSTLTIELPNRENAGRVPKCACSPHFDPCDKIVDIELFS